MEKSTAMQGVAWSVWGGEAISVIFDLRWALVLVVVLVATDFWWGRAESSILYDMAKKADNHVAMEAYKFRWSRAIRRTLNKFVDYITFVLIGTLVGVSITENYGILDHTQTAALGLIAAVAIEIISIWGHVKTVRHLDSSQFKTAGKIASVLIRKKSEELADVIDTIVTENEQSSQGEHHN